MKLTLLLILISILFFGCSEKKIMQKKLLNKLPSTYLLKSTFNELPKFNEESYNTVLKEFINNCKTKKSKKIYGNLCKNALHIQDAKSFLITFFDPYILHTKNGETEGVLTAYYEPQLHASLEKKKEFKYPLYETPHDLIIVDLTTIYPELKHYRLRGRLVGKKLLPYDTRAQSKNKKVNADIICYCDSKIDRFFLEIQGSGRVSLDNNQTIFVGYANQNGHRYRAIGRYLVKIGALALKDVSLQSIKKWLLQNPSRVDEVLNYNKSIVYFEKRKHSATGALGLVLHAKRSVAVDTKYIPLGSMLYISAKSDTIEINRFVFAQDVGGAIKGAVRADIFLGTGAKALEIAGKLNAHLKLWILLPKHAKEKFL